MAKEKAKRKYNYTKKTGRPSRYKERFCQDIIKFFDVEPWETPRTERRDGDGNVSIEEGKRQYRRMPSLLGFAKSVGVDYVTVYRWVDEKGDQFHPEFCKAYNVAMKLRKQWLIDVGLSGLAPANSFKFVAVNCSDMRDKHEHDVKSEIKIDIVDYGKSNPTL